MIMKESAKSWKTLRFLSVWRCLRHSVGMSVELSNARLFHLFNFGRRYSHIFPFMSAGFNRAKINSISATMAGMPVQQNTR